VKQKDALFLPPYLAVIAIVSLSMAAMAQQGNAELGNRLAAVKQSIAQNQQRLHQYQWTETTEVTLKGEPKPPKQALCQYGPDGQIQKTPIMQEGAQQQRTGALKSRAIKKKTEEIQDYMDQVKTLLTLYVPPDPQKLQQAYQTGNASLSKGASQGVVILAFHNYDKPGDELTITFNAQRKKLAQLNVKTYMQDPSESVTLDAQFASLPDGTNYPQKTVLNMAAKQMVVTTTNSQYQKLQ